MGSWQKSRRLSSEASFGRKSWRVTGALEVSSARGGDVSARRMWTELKKTSSCTLRKDFRLWKRLKMTRSVSVSTPVSSDWLFWMRYLQKEPCSSSTRQPKLPRMSPFISMSVLMVVSP